MVARRDTGRDGQHEKSGQAIEPIWHIKIL